MLDEIDKLGARLPRRSRGGAARGARPRAEQHVLAITTSRSPFDLSKVHVHRDGEPARPDPAAPLRDRMEIIELPGYTREEKIAHRAQPPRAEAARGARPHARTRSRSPTTALVEIIDSYTREAGVRNLEREIAERLPRRRREGRRAARPGTQRGRSTADGVEDVPRAREVLHRGRRAHGEPGRRDGPRVDGGRRRHPLHRGDEDARQGHADPHRPARRRDEGVGAGGALVRPLEAPRRSASTGELPREDGPPHPRPGGRDPEGRARRPASRCSPRSSRCSRASACATTSR